MSSQILVKITIDSKQIQRQNYDQNTPFSELINVVNANLKDEYDIYLRDKETIKIEPVQYT